MSSASSPYQGYTPMTVPTIHMQAVSSVYSDISQFMQDIISLTPPEFISAYGKAQMSMLKVACDQVVQLANRLHFNATEVPQDFKSAKFLLIDEHDEAAWFKKLYQQLNEAICHVCSILLPPNCLELVSSREA